MSLPDPVRRYVAGAVSLDDAVRDMKRLVPDGAFNFSPTDVSPADLVKVMAFMKAFAIAESPDAAQAVADLDPKEMARIAEHMRNFGTPPS